MFSAIHRSRASRGAVSRSPDGGGRITGDAVLGRPIPGASPASGSPLSGGPGSLSDASLGAFSGSPKREAAGAKPPVRRPSARAPRSCRALFALCTGATILLGCPLYPDECDSRNDCASGFYCDQVSQRCEPILEAIGCTRPSQCEVGETCTPDFVCRPGSCDYHGCVRGYRCGIVDLAHTCVPNVDGEGPSDASLPPPGDAGTRDAGLELDAGTGAGDGGADASL